MQRQEPPAAATLPPIQLLPNSTVIALSQQQPSAIELLPNSTVIALSQQQPSAAPATQPSAAMPTAATGATLNVLPPHDVSGPSASRLMKHVREGQGCLRLKVKGPTMPLPAVPTAASQPIGPLGNGQPISAPQKGRQTVTQTELPLSTQPKLPLSTQSGAVHSSPMNPVHSLSSPRGSPLSPVHPLSSPRSSASSPESARRQWLLTDSFRQRQATCKEALKAAQQDVLKWLKDQKVVRTRCFLCLL